MSENINENINVERENDTEAVFKSKVKDYALFEALKAGSFAAAAGTLRLVILEDTYPKFNKFLPISAKVALPGKFRRSHV